MKFLQTKILNRKTQLVTKVKANHQIKDVVKKIMTIRILSVTMRKAIKVLIQKKKI